MTLKELEATEEEEVTGLKPYFTVKKDATHYFFFDGGKFAAMMPIPYVRNLIKKRKEEEKKAKSRSFL